MRLATLTGGQTLRDLAASWFSIPSAEKPPAYGFEELEQGDVRALVEPRYTTSLTRSASDD
jgi:hypothetical protein